MLTPGPSALIRFDLKVRLRKTTEEFFASKILALAVANCYTSHSAYKILLQEPSGEATLSPKRPIYYHGSRSLLPETREGEREFAHPKFAKFEELNLLGGIPPLPSFVGAQPAAGRLRSD